MPSLFDRRSLIAGLAAVVARPAIAATPEITVHRSPGCGCCIGWVRHMERAGFKVKVVNQDDLAPIKKSAGVPAELESCHTAFVDGYVVEGHVPAEIVQKLLAERPAIIGVAVAEMPLGTPGMEAPGQKPDPFKVMTIPRQGKPGLFADFPEGYRAKG